MLQKWLQSPESLMGFNVKRMVAQIMYVPRCTAKVQNSNYMQLSRLEKSNRQASKWCESTICNSKQCNNSIWFSLRLIFRPDVFNKTLGLFICGGEGKINMKSREAMIKKKKKKKLFINLFSFPCLLHDQAIHDRNVETLCSTVCALTFFLQQNTPLLSQIS